MATPQNSIRITYRKTRSGEWVAFGPASIVKPGTVTVTKKDGSTKQETVLSVGKPFDVDGVAHVYGKIAQRSYASGGCVCDEWGCCRPHCRCDSMCACKGGPVYDCLG